jgi:hypothetical protein
MTKLYRNELIVSVFSMICFFSSICYCEDNEFERNTLEGLTGTQVVVEPIPVVLRNAGLTPKVIETDVELKLRKVGLRVFPNQKEIQDITNNDFILYANNGNPGLYITVSVHHTDDDYSKDIYVIIVDVEFIQTAYLTRNKKLASPTTWSVRSVSSLGVERLMGVRGDIKDGVDKFVNAYLLANPKRKKEKVPD